MNLSDELISQLTKLTAGDGVENSETTVYGTIVQEQKSGQLFVQLDGSDKFTPISTTANYGIGDRVIVQIKNHSATITGNLTSPSAGNSDVQAVDAKVTDVGTLVAGQITAESARIDSLVTETAVIRELLSADNAEIGNIVSNNVEILERLTAAEADIDDLDVNKLDATIAAAVYATIENLNATNAKVYNLEGTYADFAVLMFGSATGNTIQSSFANAIIAQLGDAQIKSAMIDSVSASKIKAGEIITNNVSVKSSDGRLILSDETLQISDANRVRVQIGKDADNDYSINIWDQNGKLMFSKGGITDNAIKDAIIRNDMVSDTANIAAHKLDIDSLFEEINGSDKTIKSTKIYLDEEKQTLDVAFKSMTSTVEDQGETITSQGTAISTIQGQISSKVWQQDIDTATGNMSTQYSTLEQDLNGFKTTVSETFATNTEQLTSDIDLAQSTAENAQITATTAESLVQQLSESISMLVTDGNGTSLMTQTESGWTFSTANIQTSVSNIANDLDVLTNELGSTSNAVDVLKQAVDDLGEIAEYVKIGTYEDEPCIELGESDSEFKMRITNTRILFMEGSNVVAHISNQSLHIKKAVVEEELQQGGFVWQVRSNGNMGLIWKGVSS